MDPKPVVLDISSDEEGWGETGGGGGGCNDIDWLSKLLEGGDGESDCSDDVVLVGEVTSNPKPRLKRTITVVKSTSKDLDDDCVVLEGDPDKAVEIENDKAAESDELLIVGEKGQIACRDYPHSRHLCAKFPFSSTPHERHCSMCHCYVCDSHAPCVHWGDSSCCFSHCHATDKDEYWKLQRKSFKQVIQPPPNIPISGGILPLINQVPTSCLSQNQISVPSVIRSCSSTMSTNPNISTFSHPVRTRRPGYPVPTNRFHPHLVSQHLLNSRSNIIQKDRRHNVTGNLGSKFLSSGSVFKRTGLLGGVGWTTGIRSSGYNNNYGSVAAAAAAAPAAAIDKNPVGSRDFYSGMATDTYKNYTQQDNTGGSVFENSLAGPQPVGHAFVNIVPQQVSSSEPNIGCAAFMNTVPLQPQAPSHYNTSNMQVIFASPMLDPQASLFLPDMKSSCISASLSQVYGQDQDNNNNNNTLEPPPNDDSQVLDGSGSFYNYDSTWIDPPPPPPPPPPYNHQPPTPAAAAFDESSSTIMMGELNNNTQFPGCTEPASLDFAFDDDWFLGNHHLVAGPLENVLSPEPAHIDTGIFFDF